MQNIRKINEIISYKIQECDNYNNYVCIWYTVSIHKWLPTGLTANERNACSCVYLIIAGMYM